ncbi:MAG: helix-turn-helix transcriptional regulator [Alphaproteobacteria bacterium]|nr:helix-turn-helix transcriptional regulator [Alphaproteobacteria bacterium]
MIKAAEEKRKTKGIPDYIDRHVGKRLRVRRSLLGISQEKLAEAVGVTFQQIQKYERGTNRISASRLLKFSQILQVPVDFFYDQLESEESSTETYGFADTAQDSFETGSEKLSQDNLMEQKETLELVRAYYSVSDKKVRKDILKFIKTMAQNIA